MKKVYIVIGAAYYMDGESKHTWVARIFTIKQDAEAHKDKLNELDNRVSTAESQLRNLDEKYEGTCAYTIYTIEEGWLDEVGSAD